jgi:hypothetical protein
MTDATRQLTGTVDGQRIYGFPALALLYGIDAEVVRVAINFGGTEQPNLEDIPIEWRNAGRRRGSEATAATGSDELLDVLRYWAARDYGASVTINSNGDAYLTA